MGYISITKKVIDILDYSRRIIFIRYFKSLYYIDMIKRLLEIKKIILIFFELKDLNKIMLYYFKSVDDREFMS